MRNLGVKVHLKQGISYQLSPWNLKCKQVIKLPVVPRNFKCKQVIKHMIMNYEWNHGIKIICKKDEKILTIS